MLEISEKKYNQFSELLKELTVKNVESAHILMMYLLTIGEQFGATLSLIKNGFGSHAPVIMRSMLEAHVNLLNLVKDPNFISQLRYEDTDQRLKTFKAFEKIYKKFTKPENFDAELERCQKEWDAFGNPKPKNMPLIDKCDTLENPRLYDIYRYLCSSTHNQLLTLFNRHGVLGEFVLKFCDKPSKENEDSWLKIALYILLESAKVTPHFTDLSKAEIEDFTNAANEDLKSALETHAK